MTPRQRWLAGPNNYRLHGPWSSAVALVGLVYLVITGHWTWQNLLLGIAVGVIGATVFCGIAIALFVLTIKSRPKPQYPCPICGYDVRATLNRCPECGAELQWGQLPNPPEK